MVIHQKHFLPVLPEAACSAFAALLFACAMGNVPAAFAGTVASQQQNTTTSTSYVNDLQQNLRIFTVAAQKYVFENTGNVPWNVNNNSPSPIEYAPFLLYAGAATSANAATICGFQPVVPAGDQAVPGFSQPVSLEGTLPIAGLWTSSVTWTPPSTYLPAQWNPIFQGTYCAVVTLNQPAAQQVTLVSYYVAPNGTETSTLNAPLPPSALAFQGQQSVQSVLPSPLWKPAWKPVASSNSSAQGWQLSNIPVAH